MSPCIIWHLCKYSTIWSISIVKKITRCSIRGLAVASFIWFATDNNVPNLEYSETSTLPLLATYAIVTSIKPRNWKNTSARIAEKKVTGHKIDNNRWIYYTIPYGRISHFERRTDSLSWITRVGWTRDSPQERLLSIKLSRAYRSPHIITHSPAYSFV